MKKSIFLLLGVAIIVIFVLYSSPPSDRIASIINEDASYYLHGLADFKCTSFKIKNHYTKKINNETIHCYQYDAKAIDSVTTNEIRTLDRPGTVYIVRRGTQWQRYNKD